LARILNYIRYDDKCKACITGFMLSWFAEK